MTAAATTASEIPISSYEDILVARQHARTEAQRMGFGMIDQTKIVTAVSELARNIVVHAGKGRMRLSPTPNNSGLTLEFTDHGPGFKDVDHAMSRSVSTTNSLGLGLSGARSLSDAFDIRSTPGKGTTVTITKYLKK